MAHEINFEVIESLDDFYYTDKFVALAVGPIGCVAGDTLVMTEFGAIPISDIDRPMRVLSWNEKTGRYQLSLCGGSFPKGKDYLYRVVTPQGEFDAAESHLLLCADGEYRKVSELRVGDALAACSHDPVQYGQGSYPSEFPVDEPCYSQTDVSCLGGYAALARQCGQPFLRGQDSDLASAPLQGDAQKPTLFSSFHKLWREGVLSALSPSHSHCGLFGDLFCTDGLPYLPLHQQNGAAYCGEAEFSARGGSSFRPFWLFRGRGFFRRIKHALVRPISSLLRPFVNSPSYGRADRPIILLTRKQVKEAYWDLQVEGTENYVTVDGCIHHNSTKTTAGIMKIIYHASQMAPDKHGVRKSRAVWVRNTREQLRDTSIPDFLKWIPDGVMGSFLKTEYKFVIKVGDIECEVLFRGLDDANDVRRLLSLQASFIIFDEFREIHPDIYNTAQGRIGRYPDKMINGVGCKTDDGRPNAHMWGMSNPPDMDTFWHDILFNPPDNVHVTIQPSGLAPEADWTQFLPDDYYDNLAKGKTEDWIDVYIHAKFGKSLSGQPVFKSFNKDSHVAKKPLTPMQSSSPIIIGVDAGLTPAAVIAEVAYDGRLVVYDALVSEEMGALRFIREKLKPLLTNKFSGRKYQIIIDPAAFQRVQTDERCVADIYRAEGFSIKPARTNAIAARLAAVEKYLSRVVDGKYGIVFDPEGASPLIKALAGKYRYKINTKGEKDEKPEKSHPWSDVCFIEGTRIKTPYGDVPVEDLQIGDLVCVADGIDVVTGNGSRVPHEDLLELSLSDGSVLTCTKEHPFSVKSHSCFLPADTLTCKHVLETVEDGVWASGQWRTRAGIGLQRIASSAGLPLKYLSGKLTKARVSIAQNPVTALAPALQMASNTMAYGSLEPERTITTGTSGETKPVFPSTNMYGRSITGQCQKGSSSTTLTMTQQITLWRTLSCLIPENTHDNTSSNASKTVASTLRQALRKLGRLLKHGIGLLKAGSGTDSILTVVSTKTVPTQKVFNLTTERTHTYYAGGVLVHNCDAFQYICLHADGGETFGVTLESRERREIKPVSAVGWT